MSHESIKSIRFIKSIRSRVSFGLYYRQPSCRELSARRVKDLMDFINFMDFTN